MFYNNLNFFFKKSSLKYLKPISSLVHMLSLFYLLGAGVVMLEQCCSVERYSEVTVLAFGDEVPRT